ncbi:hypothetical protein HF1_13440 [Mycoplasma haemofelis str. Langford 1]|uniref:Uncharacterized protein n=1 Tax=Mycoplasma haemofelis (strain Langford 1) TaxID=941640 RepID=E8ZJN1_MYCHL|nr:hypothetical protein [Mycoplasma haemofelis]CBY93352.1 hypothetical protein HF1_13440 [Mycoplasma haemofelis str. Langford 1]
MSLPFKAAALTTGLGGAASAGLGGAYFNSKETIGSKLGDDVLGKDNSFNESWKNQKSKLDKEQDDLKGFPKLSLIKKNSNTEQAWIELRDWCSDSYSFTYKSIFSKEDNSRLNLTKKYCIQAIKERLEALYTGGNKKVLDVTGNTDQNEFISNYKKLKTHNEDTDGKLTGSLAGINKSNAESEANTHWSKVKEWCSSIHGKPFKGSDNVFKLAEKLCVKAS